MLFLFKGSIFFSMLLPLLFLAIVVSNAALFRTNYFLASYLHAHFGNIYRVYMLAQSALGYKPYAGLMIIVCSTIFGLTIFGSIKFVYSQLSLVQPCRFNHPLA